MRESTELFAYLMRNPTSLLKRIVVVGNTLTFYARAPFENIVGGLSYILQDAFPNAQIIKEEMLEHSPILHCCGEEASDWRHWHLKFPQAIDENLMKKIVLAIKKANLDLNNNKNFLFINDFCVEDIQEKFSQSLETDQSEWSDISSMLAIFLNSALNSFSPMFIYTFALSFLEEMSIKYNFSTESYEWASQLVFFVILSSTFGLEAEVLSLAMLPFLLKKLGVMSQDTAQMLFLLGGILIQEFADSSTYEGLFRYRFIVSATSSLLAMPLGRVGRHAFDVLDWTSSKLKGFISSNNEEISEEISSKELETQACI